VFWWSMNHGICVLRGPRTTREAIDSAWETLAAPVRTVHFNGQGRASARPQRDSAAPHRMAKGGPLPAGRLVLPGGTPGSTPIAASDQNIDGDSGHCERPSDAG
jgi:hypothetical protein